MPKMNATELFSLLRYVKNFLLVNYGTFANLSD